MLSIYKSTDLRSKLKIIVGINFNLNVNVNHSKIIFHCKIHLNVILCYKFQPKKTCYLLPQFFSLCICF